VHAGLVDMKAIGRKGGKVSPQTKLRKAADDDLREQARSVLSRALAGEQVDKQALDAARSLFSYRAEQAPQRDPRLSEYDGPLMPDGSRPVSLGDVLAFAMTANESTRAVAEAWIAQAHAIAAEHPAQSSEGVPVRRDTAKSEPSPAKRDSNFRVLAVQRAFAPALPSRSSS
jgi:hypothetical protein